MSDRTRESFPDSNVSGPLSSPRSHWMRAWRHPDGPSTLVGAIIALAVCFPFFGTGRLFLLDWSIGPHAPILTSAFYGLNGGLTAGVLDSIVMGALNHVLGGPATWLPVVAFFPLATFSAGRLAGGPRWSRAAAGIFYAVNPFVFNRLFVGHIPLLIGYALLPLATKGALQSMTPKSARWFTPALWWALLTALSPHFAWIYGVVIAAVALVSLRHHGWRRVLGWSATVAVAFVLSCAYLIAPHLVTNLPTQVGQISLDLYRTSADPHLGLFVNVLGLYGFWRLGPGPDLPKNVVSGWPFILLAILMVVGVGARTRLRRSGEQSQSPVDESDDPPRDPTSPVSIDPQRNLALILVVVGVCGYFLALGDQGPTGPLFRWVYVHVPFFAIMREPQKFVMLVALAYAVFFGWGAEHVAHLFAPADARRRLVATALLGVAIPLAYTPTIFNGLAGQLSISTLPSSYQRADALMGSGAGNVLYLPWHLYMSYPFTQGRVIANGGPASFNREVIAGDNVQSGDVTTQSTSPESAYLEALFARSSQVHYFGALVAPLGVKYVVLSKTVDWATYDWLAHQRDLRLILDSPALEVWRNDDYHGVGAQSASLTYVTGIDGLIALSNSHRLNHGLVLMRTQRSPQHHVWRSRSIHTPPAANAIERLSHVRYRIQATRSGWAITDSIYEHGWQLDGHPTMRSAEGTVLVRLGTSGHILTFSPWKITFIGYLATLIVVGAEAWYLARSKR